MTQYKVLAIAEGERIETIESLLESENINKMATIPARQENIPRASSMPVDAVVIYSQGLDDTEQRFIEQLYMTRGKIAFVLVSENPSADVYGKAMACGITRVLPVGSSATEVCAAVVSEIVKIQNRVESADVREYDSRVLSVFSTKGGTGKTTIAVNLAAALQHIGKKVALLDLDLQFGDVSIFLNIPHCETISDLASEQSITPNVVNSFLFKHRSGLQVLCAPESPELAELVKPELVDNILNILRVEFDYVICDLAPSIDDISLMAVDRSDSVYFVTTPEIPTLKNTHTCLGVLGQLNYGEKIHLILNRDGDSYVSANDVKAALNKPVDYVIPNDPKSASAAMNRGIPVVLTAPKSDISKTMYQFAAAEAGYDKKALRRILRMRKKEV